MIGTDCWFWICYWFVVAPFRVYDCCALVTDLRGLSGLH